MVKLKILEKKSFGQYLLKDEQNKKRYSICLQFFDDINPQIGDEFTLDEELLNKTNPNFAEPLCFEKAKRQQVNEKDLIILFSNNQKMLLKRIYG